MTEEPINRYKRITNSLWGLANEIATGSGNHEAVPSSWYMALRYLCDEMEKLEPQIFKVEDK